MATASVARVYADVNANMPRSYWDYDSVNIAWGILENYEVVRKIGASLPTSVVYRSHTTVQMCKKLLQTQLTEPGRPGEILGSL
jgi:hypothetical protein